MIVDGDVAQNVSAKLKPKRVQAYRAGPGRIFYNTLDGGREAVQQGHWLVVSGSEDEGTLRLEVLSDHVFRTQYDVQKGSAGA